MIISGYTMEYFEEGKEQTYSVCQKEEIYSNQKTVRCNLHKYFDNMMMAVPWNKLYQSKYIKDKNLRFPNLKWDDLHFNMEVIMDIESVAISNCDGYHFLGQDKGLKLQRCSMDSYIRRERNNLNIFLKYIGTGG